MKKYHLWYTGKVLKKVRSGNTILTQIRGDYMGSAEFEFGAVPGALANFLTSQEELVFNKVIVEGNLYRYWVRKSQEEMLVAAITNYKDTVKGLKEIHTLSDFFSGNVSDTCIFGIDEGYECFIYTNKTLTSRFKDTKENTVNVLRENEWIE